jgi:hypothetical protein
MATVPRSASAASGPIARFRGDLHRRYPARSGVDDDSPTGPRSDPGLSHRLEKLPPEIGVLLIVVGMAGLLLPGPVGSPFLVAGGVALWPSAVRKAEDWLRAIAPRLYEEGLQQMERFLADLERRYPGSTR